MEEERKLENELNMCRVRGEGLRKALDEVYANASKRVEERFRELKDQSFALEERAKKVGEAEAKLIDLEMEVEKKRKELNFIKNQVEVSRGESNVEEVRLSQLRILVEECEAEQVLKASELSEMGESWRKTHLELAKMETELERKTKDFTLVQTKLVECEKLLETSSSELFKTQDELECKREHLGQMEAEIESLGGAQTHMRQLVEEVERKTKGLYLVRTKLLECEKLVKTSSSELMKTQGELECKQAQLGEMEADLERHRVKVSAEMESLRGTQNHMRELDEEVEKKTEGLTLVQTKLVEFEKLLETSSSELIKTQGELECKREQLGQMEADFQMHHVKVSAEKELWERTQTHRRELEEEIERKRKDLTMFLDKIAECETQLESVEEQLDSQQKMLETQSSELVSKEKQLEMLNQKINLREQTVMSLNNDMKEACQQMETKGKELENVQKLIEEKSAQCESLTLLIEEHNQQLASAEIAPEVSAPVNSVLSLDVKLEEPISNSVASRCSLDIRQDITSSHLPIEDALLRDIEDSTSLSPDEVSSELRMFKDPGRFVLTSVEKALTDASERGEFSLEEPILMPLVHLLEELARVGISTDPDLQSDATRVADRWVEMMGASVEKSQVEAWAFLQFIVAFGLVKGTKQDDILQLASYVAHFKHAPRLFESLGLTDAIPNFVTQLFGKGLYIPAIRLMFTFNVKKNFSPLELLKVQIINLRRSAKENKRYESQAEEASRDAATMMDIMELIEDFKLEIDIPADLILKFIVPASSVPVNSTHMPASDSTDIQSSCVATHGLNPSLPTSFGTEPSALFQGQQHSHHAGSKRPRVLDPEGTRPVIRPCSNPPSGFGSF